MKASILATLSGASTALAAVHGFNYASQGQDLDGFTSQFKTAASLQGAEDFTSARLYTMIQDGTTDTPISAIQAAINTGTTLLLGLWASVPQSSFDNEITALKSAIQQYGTDFADLVVGISVGSEDLYRISPTGLANDPTGVGQAPDVLVDYISQVRDAIQGTSLGSKPVGHVDTWNVYVNDTNAEVIKACDFLGLDEYPYFQTTDANDIDNGESLFFQAYDRVAAVSQGATVWITESGWPTSGSKSNEAVASVNNAELYWQDVACQLISRDVNFWWYILADEGASPSFGVSENGKPLYDLTCHATNSTSNSTASGSSTASGGSGTSGSHTQTGSVHTQTGSVTVTASGAATATGSFSFGGEGTAGGSSPTGTATVTENGGASSTASGVNVQSATGAASKAEGSIAALAMGGLIAALFF